MTGPVEAPSPLQLLELALDGLVSFTNRTEDRLAFQVLDEAPALLEPGERGWTLRVFFLVGEVDRVREAAQRFAAKHGGRLSLKGQRLTISTPLVNLDPDEVLKLYRTACLFRHHLSGNGEPLS